MDGWCMNTSFKRIDKKIGMFYYVGFYGILTIVGYFMPIPLYTYMLNIFDLVMLGFMALNVIQCQMSWLWRELWMSSENPLPEICTFNTFIVFNF